MKKLVALIAALAVAAAIYFVTREEGPAPTKVTVVPAHRSKVTKTVRAVGHVEPVTMVNVSSNITGELLALHVKEGDRVETGAPLAEIDRERLLAVYRQNEANARSLEAQVELEKATLDRARSEQKRTIELHAKGLATDTDRDQANSEVEITTARLESATQRVAQARALVDEARDRLGKARIAAPIAGTVISLKKKKGERIRGSDLSEDILLTLAPLVAMQVEVEVSEQDVVSIVVGDETMIEIDAIEGSKIPGSVVEIANSAEIKNRGTEMETTTFLVKVSLGEVPTALRPGMTASVEIVTDVHDDVIAVPIEAVTARLPSQLEKKPPKRRGFFDGARVDEDEDNRVLRRREKPIELVFVVEDGVAKVRPVKTGIASDLDFEIVEGVREGDAVIVSPYRALAETLYPDAPVEVEERTTLGRDDGAPVAAQE